jgi:hypothetical protein
MTVLTPELVPKTNHRNEKQHKSAVVEFRWDRFREWGAASRPGRILVVASCLLSRQLIFGDNVDLDRINAGYRDGVLHLVIPVAEKAKPRKINIDREAGNAQDINTGRHNGMASSATTIQSMLRWTAERT